MPRNPTETPAGEPRAALYHSVYFESQTIDGRPTGRWRAICVGCGWGRVGTRAEVQSLASSHDVEWVRVMNEAQA